MRETSLPALNLNLRSNLSHIIHIEKCFQMATLFVYLFDLDFARVVPSMNRLQSNIPISIMNNHMTWLYNEFPPQSFFFGFHYKHRCKSIDPLDEEIANSFINSFLQKQIQTKMTSTVPLYSQHGKSHKVIVGKLSEKTKEEEQTRYDKFCP